MKKLLISLSFVVIICNLTTAQNVVIPDTLFKNYLLTDTLINTNGDGEISFAEAAAYQDTISLSHYHLTSLDGIEAFINITGLNCEGDCCGGGGVIRNLNVSNCTKLRFINCSNNKLNTLDVSNDTALVELDCNKNNISHLNVSANKALVVLQCYTDSISSLDVSQNTLLKVLWCNNNQLSNLDVSNNTALADIDCDNNLLTGLDVSHNPALESFMCFNNQLASLDVTNNPLLTFLFCHNNPYLTTICVSSVSNAVAQEANSNYLKDDSAAWSETCAIGIQSTKNNSTIDVFPNPSSGLFTISGADKESSIAIYNSTGALLFTANSIDLTQKIDLSKYAKGIYWYTVSTQNSQLKSGKIIVQ